MRVSFIPLADIRHLRLIARQRQKLGGMLASEKNRLHKLLADAGIRLNVLVSDLHGQAGRAMVKALIAGKPMPAILDCAGRLRATRAELFEALQPEELSAKHLFVLAEVMAHIEYLGTAISRFEQTLLDGLSAWQPQLVLLQTIPGIDQMGAAKLAPSKTSSRRCLSARGHKKSIVALACKMLRIIHAMLTHGTPYQDRTVDYEALVVQRNAPRWIKILAKHGYIAATA